MSWLVRRYYHAQWHYKMFIFIPVFHWFLCIYIPNCTAMPCQLGDRGSKLPFLFEILWHYKGFDVQRVTSHGLVSLDKICRAWSAKKFIHCITAKMLPWLFVLYLCDALFLVFVRGPVCLIKLFFFLSQHFRYLVSTRPWFKKKKQLIERKIKQLWFLMCCWLYALAHVWKSNVQNFLHTWMKLPYSLLKVFFHLQWMGGGNLTLNPNHQHWPSAQVLPALKCIVTDRKSVV